MSMLSEQVNELRMLADKLRKVHARQGDDFVESCETLYWSMCAMREAADTIESLRDRLQESMLGSWECEFVIEDNMNETEGMGDVWFRCTSCDMCFDYYADDWLMKMNYCPNCGKAVKR